MLVTAKKDRSGPGCGERTLQFLARMTRKVQSSSYSRMDSDVKENKRRKKSKDDRKAEEFSKGKEYDKTSANKEVKEKKSKKKGWKRVRQAALTTCRYIGMGAAHMNPAAAYASPDYYVDPKYWNRSFNSSYKYKAQHQTPHWSSNMMFAGW